MKTFPKFTPSNFRRMILWKVTAKQVGWNVWAVNSTTDERKAYLITTSYSNGVLSLNCNCRAGLVRQGCRHAMSVAKAIDADLRLLPVRKAA